MTPVAAYAAAGVPFLGVPPNEAHVAASIPSTGGARGKWGGGRNSAKLIATADASP
jgi:hypothetical protein